MKELDGIKPFVWLPEEYITIGSGPDGWRFVFMHTDAIPTGASVPLYTAEQVRAIPTEPVAQAIWHAIGDEAECVVQGGRKYLMLSEEMCMRLSDALGGRHLDALAPVAWLERGEGGAYSFGGFNSDNRAPIYALVPGRYPLYLQPANVTETTIYGRSIVDLVAAPGSPPQGAAVDSART